MYRICSLHTAIFVSLLSFTGWFLLNQAGVLNTSWSEWMVRDDGKSSAPNKGKALPTNPVLEEEAKGPLLWMKKKKRRDLGRNLLN